MTLSPLNEVTSYGTFISFLYGVVVDRSNDSSSVRTVFLAVVPTDIVPSRVPPDDGPACTGPGVGPDAGPACLDVLRFDISDKKSYKEANKKKAISS